MPDILPWFETQQTQSEAIINENLNFIPCAVEKSAEVISRKLYNKLARAALQRAEAIKAFCADVYISSPSRIENKIPRFRRVLHSNSQFVKALIGTEVALNHKWDFPIAMDFVMDTSIPGGVYITESDSGGIGGVFKIGLLHRQLQWSIPANIYVDSSQYLDELLESAASLAKHFNGKVLMYSENDIFENGVLLKEYAKLLNSGVMCVCSSHNIQDISFDEEKMYFNGDKIGLIWIRYYSSAIDPTIGGCDKLMQLFDSGIANAHQKPNFWGHYIRGGYKHSSCLNMLGSELLCDKATSALVDEMIRFYLNQSPIIPDKFTHSLLNEAGDLDKDLLDCVATQRANWVIKPTETQGHACGIKIGPLESDDSWAKQCVKLREKPNDFIVQRCARPVSFSEMGGLSKRYPEFRMITYSINGNVHLIPGILARTSSERFAPKNLSGLSYNSIVPILIPK